MALWKKKQTEKTKQAEKKKQAKEIKQTEKKKQKNKKKPAEEYVEHPVASMAMISGLTSISSSTSFIVGVM